MNEQYQKVFNSGVLTLVPSITVSTPVPTPVQVATLKDVSLDISFTVKELQGSNSFPEDIAIGPGKISGKAKSGRIFGGVLAAVMQGVTSATGQVAAVYDERISIPKTTSYTCTVSQAATWQDDLGVINLDTGLTLERIAVNTADPVVPPVTGQYWVADGVYTFAVADKGANLSFRYTYTMDTGVTFSLSNILMGSVAQLYQLHLYNSYQGLASGFKLYACLFPKLSLAYKAGDYMETDLDFQACADATGKIIDFFKA